MFFAVRLLLLLPLLGVVNAITRGYYCDAIPGKLRQIDAGDGHVVGVNSNDEIFRRQYNDWRQLDGRLMHVTAGPAGIWGVNRAYQVFQFTNNAWTLTRGSLKQIDAGGEKFVSGVNAQDNVFCSRKLNAYTGLYWRSVEGSLKYHSCGKWGCWGVNRDNNIYFHHGVTSNYCQGSEWQHIEGKLVMIEAGTDGYVYGINAAGDAYRRDGIDFLNIAGTSWTQLDLGHKFKHLSYSGGYLWLITLNDDIIRCGIRL